ncbi:hypothetical protein BCV70DRAFT_200824 [Testicularia cyperi]|uniref:Uncharacterized protein n=1 Tax=Testicularia cyperi TaxID=1882483 RepID=A0A317XNJ9_9BASI|nr:hypothetical protein BCV70DRAFT_200824 [Testicularia cyperi]
MHEWTRDSSFVDPVGQHRRERILHHSDAETHQLVSRAPWEGQTQIKDHPRL